VSDAARTVLIVEDDAATRAVLRTFFGVAGHRVLEAADGAAGLALIDDDVDIVLLDLMMPGMGGLEVLRRLRTTDRRIPVIVMTALNDVETAVQAMQAGATDYVTRPLSLPVLLSRVEAALRPREVDVEAADVIAESDEDAVRVVMAPSVWPSPAAPVPVTLPASTTPRSAMVPAPSTVPRTATPLPRLATPPPLPVVVGSEVGPAAAPSVASPSVAPGALPRTSSTLLSRLTSFTRRILPGEQPELEAGVVLDRRYRLLERLGAGTFGAVWRARHLELDADMAVKVLHKDAKAVRPHESALESFRREAVLTARVESIHVAKVTDFGVTAEGHAFLVMELLRGETLRQRLQRGPLPPKDACRVVADVCAALACAHRAGVVHRDVKAINVYCASSDEGEVVKLIDFGAAGTVDDPKGGVVLVGTPTHMAPERFTDARGTPESDVYAAGVLLHHCLLGTLPFISNDVEDLARMHRAIEPRPPSRSRPELAPIDAILLRMLAKQPERRPTAQQVATALRGLIGG
jgi:CheY-like chemotaxis protein